LTDSILSDVASSKTRMKFPSRSGGIRAYEINRAPTAVDDEVDVAAGESSIIDALANDVDPNGDRLRFVRVAGQEIDTGDGLPDTIERPYGTLVVVNPGDDPDEPEAAYVRFEAAEDFVGGRTVPYTVEDLAPKTMVNGVELDEPNPTHTPRIGKARIRLI
jgi:hypothetical protein